MAHDQVGPGTPYERQMQGTHGTPAPHGPERPTRYDPLSDPGFNQAFHDWWVDVKGNNPIDFSKPHGIGLISQEKGWAWNEERRQEFLASREGQAWHARRAGDFLYDQSMRDISDMRASNPGYYDSLLQQGLREGDLAQQQRGNRQLSQLARQGGIHTGAYRAQGRASFNEMQNRRDKTRFTVDTARRDDLRKLTGIQTGLGKLFHDETSSVRDLNERRRQFDETMGYREGQAEAGAYSDLAGGALKVGGAVAGSLFGPTVSVAGGKIADAVWGKSRG